MRVVVVHNCDISPAQLVAIRSLPDFDLVMLLSEIHDNGWQAAAALLPAIQADLLRRPATHEGGAA